MSKKDQYEIANSFNKKIVEQLDLLIKKIQYNLNNDKLEKSDIIKYRFKLKHFKNALRIIKLFPDKINKGEDLKNISGIGKGTISRINEIIKNKKLKETDTPEIKKIKKEMDLITELSKVINIGPKVAKQLIIKNKIKSINDLKKKVKSGDIEVNNKIKLGLKYHGKFFIKIPRKEVDKYNTELSKIVKKIDNDLIFTIAGSYRREKDFSNDIDILLSHTDYKTKKSVKDSDINFLQIFVENLIEKKMIVDNLTDTDNGTKYMGFSKLPRKKIRRIDVRFVPYESYHSALLYFTGSYQLNTDMRKIAKSLGYKLNEYGLFKIKKDGTTSKKSVKIKSENDIFKKLKLDYLEPKERG